MRDRVQRASAPDGPPLALSEEDDDVQAAFASLERFACRAYLEKPEAEAEPGDDAARALLQRLGRKATAEAGRQLLVAVGVWSAHENLELIRLRVPTRFSEELQEAAAAIEASPPVDADEARRRNLSHLLALAIDESSTVEVDDAMSVEPLDDGRMRLWVHIADATRYVAKGSPLELEARERSTSRYLPTGTISMFPMSLAAGPLSLREGVTSCALSFGLCLDADGGLDGSETPIVTPSFVRATRLTYLEVDRLLEGPIEPSADAAADAAAAAAADDEATADEATVDVLRRLEYLAAQRLEWRVAGGSMEGIAPDGLPDMSVKAYEQPEAPGGWAVEVTVGGARAGGVARRIVSEAMIVAGEAAARYGATHSVPLPFRAQSVREELSDEQIADCPEGPARAWLAIRQMKASYVTHAPELHEGLGLEAYVQATSPIRRHADLSVHYQLKAHLRGEPLPYPPDDAGEHQKSEIIRLARAAASSPLRGLERSANAYWLAEFLKRNGGKPLRALVLGSDARQRDTFKLLLLDLGAIVDCTSSRPLGLGDELEVAPNRLGELEVA